MSDDPEGRQRGLGEDALEGSMGASRHGEGVITSPGADKERSSSRSAAASRWNDPDILDDGGVSECLDEPLADALDLGTWKEGFGDIAQMMDRTAREVEEAKRFEDEAQKYIRKTLFPQLGRGNRPNAPQTAGVWSAPLDEVARFQRGVLFNGKAEACDGTIQVFETLPLTIVQIAVAKVSYESDGSTWSHRLYWRDLRVKNLADIGERINELLQIRSPGGGQTRRTGSRRNPGKVSELLRRGLMAYAERAVLSAESTAMWRIGHGNIAPYELLTGSGSMELLSAALEVLSALVLNHQHFLFVPSDATARDILTLGHALRPLEYAILTTAERQMLQIVDNGHYGERYRRRALDFIAEAGPKIVLGVYRASAYGPPHLFYAHDDWAHDAATFAIADSRIQEHRGFPMLIDLADGVCGATFDGTSFRAAVETAYTAEGAPFRYLRERDTRSR